ncbi:MAG: ferrochelatase [Bacteriovoracaceae bacterium]|nr:ferrochelatase [Bacteroidota bacterium]
MNEKKEKIAVVLLQLGGPDKLESVEPFLYNLFCDPDIIDVPGAFLFRKTLARIISSRRAPVVQQLYKRIGSKSPIFKQTKLQAIRLLEMLRGNGHTVDVHIAMRYWHPMTEEAVSNVMATKPDRIILLPLYPHYCKATTGSSVNEWKRVSKKLKLPDIPTVLVEHYYEHPLYIKALVKRIRVALNRVPEKERSHLQIVFSAHGTPMKLVRDGDPYSHHIRKTYERVVEQGQFGLPHLLCFQSKVGPQKWLTPSLTGTIERLGHEGATHILVVPIAFVTDHIETLSEINIEARDEALKLGVKYYDMMPALLTEELFIRCLADLVEKKIEG